MLCQKLTLARNKYENSDMENVQQLATLLVAKEKWSKKTESKKVGCT